MIPDHKIMQDLSLNITIKKKSMQEIPSLGLTVRYHSVNLVMMEFQSAPCYLFIYERTFGKYLARSNFSLTV